METTSLKEADKRKFYLAFFDLDHTITSAVSGRELAKEAFRKGLLKQAGLVGALLLSVAYKTKLISPVKAINRMGMWVKGLPVEAIEKLSAEVCESILIPSVYEEARNEINFHAANDARVVMLSSTLIPVGRYMSGNLGIHDILCSGLETADGLLTGKPDGAFCFGEEKVRRMKEHCERNNSKLQDAWYYADAYSDIPALSIVGHPVCINPERRLEKVAIKKGWKILYWNN
jgi:HAD superfamily hydrolase (TIGR01490 family)